MDCIKKENFVHEDEDSLALLYGLFKTNFIKNIKCNLEEIEYTL